MEKRKMEKRLIYFPRRVRQATVYEVMSQSVRNPLIVPCKATTKVTVEYDSHKCVCSAEEGRNASAVQSEFNNESGRGFVKRTIQTALVDTTTICGNGNASVSSFIYHLDTLLTVVHPCIRAEMIWNGVLPSCTCWLTAFSSVTVWPAAVSHENTKLAKRKMSK